MDRMTWELLLYAFATFGLIVSFGAFFTGISVLILGYFNEPKTENPGE